MQVGVAYSEHAQQIWISIEIPEPATVHDAIERSGILSMFPGIDLATQKVGVFGRIVTLENTLRAGDRVEIYRPITCDPQTVARRDGVSGDGGGDDDE